ncbi:BON domain-containing protein [Oryzomonas japonica]|uniref:BON domain-containing protein n=1 Tax=Oryzomonas japonica TaxID=2603858 RepID=A0A7J4ZMQ2_9BACT|nr:BON domain-containing protein [Oryzomonas japonica]KAB0663809.1 BON domain-containing protein [Oryzomonas japonica]
MAKSHRMLKLLVCSVLVAAPLAPLAGYAAEDRHETTGQYVDDSVITTKVKAAIFGDKTLKTLQVTVKTFKGVVQLSGFVDSAQSAARAGEVAGSVAGVKEVKNDLVVK